MDPVLFEMAERIFARVCTSVRYIVIGFPLSAEICLYFRYILFICFTSTETGFTPGGEPPLVPVPHPGASIRD
jgi:hypothetical protein